MEHKTILEAIFLLICIILLSNGAFSLDLNIDTFEDNGYADANFYWSAYTLAPTLSIINNTNMRGDYYFNIASANPGVKFARTSEIYLSDLNATDINYETLVRASQVTGTNVFMIGTNATTDETNAIAIIELRTSKFQYITPGGTDTDICGNAASANTNYWLLMRYKTNDVNAFYQIRDDTNAVICDGNFAVRNPGMPTRLLVGTNNASNLGIDNISYAFNQIYALSADFNYSQNVAASSITFVDASTKTNIDVNDWDWFIDGAKQSDANTFVFIGAHDIDYNACLVVSGYDINGGHYKTSSICKAVAIDTVIPTIDGNVVFTHGFVNGFDANVNIFCQDSRVSSNLEYKIVKLDNNVLLDVYDTNGLTKTLHVALGTGANTFRLSCTDTGQNSVSLDLNTIYTMLFRLVNEQTGANITDLNALSVASLIAFTYDGNFVYDYNITGAAQKMFMDYENVLRFELTYNDVLDTKVYREINFDLVADQNTGVCVAPFQQFYEQFMLSAQHKDVVVYNDFAKCYNLASTTKFAYQNALMVRAFTINKPYYLYTWIDGVKTLLAIIDGSKESIINLDTLEFNRNNYNVNLTGDTVAFHCLEDSITHLCDTNTVQIFYKSLRGVNNQTKIKIYNGATLLWQYTENGSPNEFAVNFFYGNLDINADDVLRLDLTTVIDGAETTTEYWFTTRGQSYSGVLNPVLAVLFSFMILFVGLTLVAYRFVFGWFGLALCAIGIIILSFAPGFWWVQFMEVVITIVAVFMAIIFVNETRSVN